MQKRRLRVLVLGYIVRCPLGGMTWHYLNYLLGLRNLGHEVFFLEDSCDYPSCYDPTRHVTDCDPTYGLKYAKELFQAFDLSDCWAYYDAHQRTWYGQSETRVTQLCASSDLLLNISGIVPLRSWIEKVPVRVMIDTDPAFEQIRQLTVPERRELAENHTKLFTFGENIPCGSSSVPKDGNGWKATRQPIVLSQWPYSLGPSDGNYTSVMQWESYPPREYAGVRYGLKGESFQSLLDLAARSQETFELAMGSANAPRELLRSRGWDLTDPLEVTRTIDTYQDFIRQSKGEFSIAKHGYVSSNCGWFSERSACYLASGRPVLAQETGFSDILPVGRGLLSFSTLEEAVEGLREIDRDYPQHCRAAREVAEECFDSRKVLTKLIDEALS